MSTLRLRLALALTMALGLGIFLAPGCEEADSPNSPPRPAGERKDFALEDMNPNSPSLGEIVDPLQYLGRVSVWYFGAAT